MEIDAQSPCRPSGPAAEIEGETVHHDIIQAIVKLGYCQTILGCRGRLRPDRVA